MKNTTLVFVFMISILAVLTGCNKKSESLSENKSNKDFKIFAWDSFKKDSSFNHKAYFLDLKQKGIDGLLYSAGHDPNIYKQIGKIAKEAGLEFQAWIPTMVQANNPELKPEWYAINGKGESAFDKPAYVPYYQFLCPNKDGVYNFLENLYSNVASLDEVDGVHLDYIRFPDVILAKGLWDKYGLVMDKEYPQFDYCYCDDCVAGFKEKYNIDIKEVEDPSGEPLWKQYRYDLITTIVNKLSDTIHKKGKVITAAVFPGPNSIAKKIVRQEWDKWNLDAFFPMNYNDFYLEGTNWIGKITEEEVKAVNNSKPVYSGLFICPNPQNKGNESDPENHGLIPEELGDAIEVSIQNGAKGICLFTPGRMTDEHWQVLSDIIKNSKKE